MKNRYKLPKGIQKKYLNKVEKISQLKPDKLAKIFNIVGRSYRDWKREKYSITEKAVKEVETRWNIRLTCSKKQALLRWKKIQIEKSRKGGYATLAKYGGPGTPEGRSKGGRYAIKVLWKKGLIPRPKPFIHPVTFSQELAEIVGILLGDGHIGKEQWSITLNAIKDKKYSKFVINLIKILFKFIPTVKVRKSINVIVISGSGINSIKYFQEIGLKIGNKVKLQVGIPKWINTKKEYRIACLRGLMDTDGGVFIHKYMVNNKRYSYKKICFSNRSIPILHFVYDVLKMLKLTPKLIDQVENKKVWLYNEKEVNCYMEIVGTHNSRLSRVKK